MSEASELGRRRASEASESESVAAQGAYKLPREGVNVRRGRRSDAEIKPFFWAPTLTSFSFFSFSAWQRESSERFT